MAFQFRETGNWHDPLQCVPRATGGDVMAIAMSPNPALKRIVEALGLDRCFSLSLSAQVGSVVTVTAEQYATETQLDALATELETRDYVLVPKDEYERLRLTDAERAAVKAAIECCEDITYGSPDEPEAAATLRGLLERTRVEPPEVT